MRNESGNAPELDEPEPLWESLLRMALWGGVITFAFISVESHRPNRGPSNSQCFSFLLLPISVLHLARTCRRAQLFTYYGTVMGFVFARPCTDAPTGAYSTLRDHLAYSCLLGVIALGVGIACRLMAGGVHRWQVRRKSDVPLCDRCGYNLTGNASGICPECGTPIVREDDHAS